MLVDWNARNSYHLTFGHSTDSADPAQMSDWLIVSWVVVLLHMRRP